jgi:hypothetical protein
MVKNLSGQKFGKLTAIEKVKIIDRTQYYWKCQCDCGKITYTTTGKLESGHTKSCGCLSHSSFKSFETIDGKIKINHIKLEPWEGTARRVYSRYKDGNIPFDLFLKLTKQNCHYCGIGPFKIEKSKYKSKEDYIYNGLDRIDSNIGHLVSNIVTSCWLCNISKRERSQEEFKKWIIDIYNNPMNKIKDCDLNIEYKENLDLYVINKNIDIKIESTNVEKYYGKVEIGQRFFRLITIKKIDKERWLCKCDCGNEKIAKESYLKCGTTKSCGCLKKEKASINYSKAIKSNMVYKSAKVAAAYSIYKNSYLDGNLTFEQFYELSQKNCIYCNKLPSQVAIITNDPNNYIDKTDENFIYNGIDRINNNLRHISMNCASCCKECNYAKSNRTREDFINWAYRVYNHYCKQ